MIGGFFTGQPPDGSEAAASTSEPTSFDPGHAAQIVEQLSNVGAASQAAQQEKTAEIAKRPQPEYTIDVVDGIPTLHAKNIPLQQPQEEIKAAAASPGEQWLASMAKTMQDYTTSLPQPNGQDIDQKLSTPEGRKQLAKEIGIEEPDHPMADGLAQHFAKRGAYRDLINDSARLKSMVAAHRFQNYTKAYEAAKDPTKEGMAIDSQHRLMDAEKRRQATEARAEESSFIQTLHGFDLSAQSTPDDAVKLFKTLAGDKWDPKLEPLVRNKYATDLVKKTAVEVEAQRKADKEARDETRDQDYRHHMARVDQHMATTERIAIGREERLAKNERPPTKVHASQLYRGTLTPDDLLAKRGNPAFDQDSVATAIDAATEYYDTAISERHDKIRELMEMPPPAKAENQPAQAARNAAKIRELTRKNARDAANLKKLRAGTSTPVAPTAAPVVTGTKGAVRKVGGKLVYQPH